MWRFSPHKAKSRKFFLPWEGPFKVLDRVNEVNYKIAKVGCSERWQLVHFNRLKPFHASIEKRQSQRVKKHVRVPVDDELESKDEIYEDAWYQPMHPAPVSPEAGPSHRTGDDQRINSLPIANTRDIALPNDNESTSNPFSGESAPFSDSRSLRTSETSQVGEPNDSAQNSVEWESAEPSQLCGEYHIYQPMDIEIPEEDESDELFAPEYEEIDESVVTKQAPSQDNNTVRRSQRTHKPPTRFGLDEFVQSK